MKSIPYAYAVGSLMYAQTCTRSDISFVIGMLGQYQSNSGMDHWKALKKVLRYLQGTKDYMLTYRRSHQLEVISCSDVDSRKSTFGYLFQLVIGAVSWKVKSGLLLLLSLWTEFMACFETTIHAVWLRNFILGLGVIDTISKLLRIYYDNSRS